MQVALRLLCFIIFALHLSVSAWAEFPLAYVGSPDIKDISLSPSTPEVAVLTKKYRYEGGAQVWDGIDIRDIHSGETRLTHTIDDRVYFWVEWISDDIILAYGRQYNFKKKRSRGHNVLVKIDPQTGKYRELYATKLVKTLDDLGGLGVIRVSFKKQTVVLAHFETKKTQLVAVNYKTGANRVLDTGTEKTITWKVDNDLTPYLRVDTSSYEHIEYYKERNKRGDWSRTLTHNKLDTRFSVQQFDPQALSFSVLTRPPSKEFTGLYEYDLKSRQYSDPIYQHPDYDLDHAKYATFEDKLLYVAWWEDKLNRHWFDDTYKEVATRLESRLKPTETWSLRETGWDESIWLIYVTGIKNPGAYMVWDDSAGKLSVVGKNRPGLSGKTLSERSRVDYKARDDLDLHGYFTPAKNDKKKGALIVIPHGGPVARDRLSWDGWAQFLAYKGYNVFQPNFRGSGGFGREFEELGHLEWGKKMQTDIEDGVHYLEARGLISENTDRAIVGASYGGYAALMAAVRTPYRYKCVVSINGVTDPINLINKYDEDDPIENYVKKVWLRRIGDPDTDLKALEAISPLYNLDKIHAEIFLSHGTRDQIVPISQSLDFYNKARQNRVRVTFKELRRARHSGWSDGLNTEVLSDINAFLLTCM